MDDYDDTNGFDDMNEFDMGDVVFGGDSDFWLEPDFVLAQLVTTLVNLSGLPLGVTLFVKGMVVTGILVSEREYLSILTAAFRTMARESLSDAGLSKKEMKRIEAALDFNKMAEGLGLPPEDADEEQIRAMIEMSSPIRHLHLKDVVILTPQPAIGFGESPMPVMRIRLTAIDGWMLGQTVGPDDEETNGEPDSSELLH